MTKNLVLAGALLAVLASPARAEAPYNANDAYNSNARHLNAEAQGASTSAHSSAMRQRSAGEASAHGRPSRTIAAPSARYLPDLENEGGGTGVSGGAAD